MARLPIVTSLFLIALIHVTMSISVQEFFPEIQNNLTKITWSHATNTREKLKEALNSNVTMMIEADVVMGMHNGTPTLIPIMAHPPATESNLSLGEFLSMTLGQAGNSKKGIKLDFKTIEAFENSTALLNQHSNPKVPVWVNADILKGPNSTMEKPVSSSRFLTGAQNIGQMRPLLSIGWTTGYQPHNQNVTSGNYTQQQIDEMLKTVNQTVKSNQSITYPVRACYAVNDIELMKSLLAGTPAANDATLTIWSHEGDKVDADKLSLLVRTIGVAKVFVDVPKDLLMKLNFNSAFTAQSSAFVVFASMLVALFTVKLL